MDAASEATAMLISRGAEGTSAEGRKMVSWSLRISTQSILLGLNHDAIGCGTDRDLARERINMAELYLGAVELCAEDCTGVLSTFAHIRNVFINWRRFVAAERSV